MTRFTLCNFKINKLAVCSFLGLSFACIIPLPLFAENADLHWDFRQVIQDGEFKQVLQMVEDGFDPLGSDENGNDYLLCAIRTDSIELVDFLLELGINPNPGEGATNTYTRCLSLAAWIGNPDIVEILINNGADVAAVTDGGETALHDAASGDSLETVRLLVEASATVDIEDTDGDTPLNETIRFGIPEIAQYLIQQGADPNHYSSSDFLPLGDAVLGQDLPMVKALIEQGVDVNMPFHEGQISTSINYLWVSNTGEIAQLLIYAGANLEVVSGDGYTPLQQAVQNENEKVACVLLAGGAEYDIFSAAGRGDVACISELIADGIVFEKHYNGLSVIQWAGRQGHESAVRLLIAFGERPGLHCYSGIGDAEKVAEVLRRGADINEFDTEGYTPLHYAVANSHFETMEFLVASGAEIDAADRWYGSPLEKAIKMELTAVAFKLIDLGAAVDGYEDNFRPPIHHAINESNYELVSYLLEKGANMYVTGRGSWLPLENAIFENDLKMAKLLLDAGYDVDALNPDGNPAMHYAIFDDNVEAVKFLLENGCNVNLEMPRGQTGIHPHIDTHIRHAYRWYNQPIIDLLYEYGAEPPDDIFTLLNRRAEVSRRASAQRFFD